ncbi:MAG TPA: deoxyguanosinetriphosphate triphosphohydrolase [Gammaproteobacteria bacterium]|nr:deoxyguanosinetriphosphate triphosphohydrolase [Gammaproteobacteria bacterium]
MAGRHADRQAAVKRESAARLAAYAATASTSRGRRYPEPPPQYRSEYQRDRDRIIHSTAFRRLMYKTQVFVYDEGDLYRTRLTHSLEVAQVARSVASALQLNEPLTEAIALAHDLGHTPFGHAGQDALNAAMRDYGGFEHNLQSLRVVDLLEEKYAEFPGLNLTYEAREGILKHCSLANARELGELGRRFIERRQPGLEAQLANLADEIAYNNHDVDDGLRAGLIRIEQLMEIELFRQPYDAVAARYPGLPARRLIHETVRRMISRLITDLIEHSRANIEAAAPARIEDVRALSAPLIAFSAEIGAQNLALARFLRTHFYYHPQVRHAAEKADQVVKGLFSAYFNEPSLLPNAAPAADSNAARARQVADYIAGMTDRFALRAYRRLTGASVSLSGTA